MSSKDKFKNIPHPTNRVWPGAEFAKFYQTEDRIKVEFTYGETTETLTGTVGVTTGWKPCFLLMLRSNSTGSVHILGQNARVVAVKRGRKYVSC